MVCRLDGSLKEGHFGRLAAMLSLSQAAVVQTGARSVQARRLPRDNDDRESHISEEIVIKLLVACLCGSKTCKEQQ